MRNLDHEYKEVNTIYEQQKEYRQTPEGKLALRRAKEKQVLRQMNSINKSRGGGILPQCVECGENRFEVLTLSNVTESVVCYNCRYERPKVLSEEEICR